MFDTIVISFIIGFVLGGSIVRLVIMKALADSYKEKEE